MKEIKKISYLIVSLLLLATSCFEEQEKLTKKWVSFDETRIERLESDDDEIEVTLSYSGALRSSDLEISYTISSPDAVEDVDYILPATSGTITIPAGESTVSFVAIEELIDNGVTNAAKSVVLTLEDAEGVTLGFPGPAGLKKSMTIAIKDDDCPYDINTLAGQYDIVIVNEGTFGAGLLQVFSTTTITVGSNPNTIVDSNIWDFGSTGVITINPTTKETTIDGVQLLYTNASGLNRYAIQGTQSPGTIVSNCGIFTVKLEVVREDQTTVANRSVITYSKR